MEAIETVEKQDGSGTDQTVPRLCSLHTPTVQMASLTTDMIMDMTTRSADMTEELSENFRKSCRSWIIITEKCCGVFLRKLTAFGRFYIMKVRSERLNFQRNRGRWKEKKVFSKLWNELSFLNR